MSIGLDLDWTGCELQTNFVEVVLDPVCKSFEISMIRT